MKFSTALTAFATIAQTVSAVAAPNPNADDGALDTRSQPDFELVERSTNDELWKRKGGGGGGGRGGGGGSSSGSGRGSGSPSTGSASGGRGSPSSNAGGRTTTGSGVTPAYGAGGVFYAGGAREPYRSGRPSPGNIVPLAVGAGAVGFLGAAYLSGAYLYPYQRPYWYHNATTDRNETKPVVCACSRDEVCSCDDNGDRQYFESIIGDGRYENLNKSVVNVAYNETDNRTYIYILGTLPNGTTAAGGDEDPNRAADGFRTLLRAVGWWPAITTALALAFAV